MSKARKAVQLMHDLGLGEVLKEMLKAEPGFATALSRSLPEQEVHLLLDLLDLGWTMRTPVSFLSQDGLVRLREVLLSHADDPAFEKRFLDALKKPEIDQVRLFEVYQIKGQDRGALMLMARKLLLQDPELALNSRELESQVEAQVKARFEGHKMAARVVTRFVS